MKEITVKELQQLKEKNVAFQLIDVREPHEVEIASIGGDHIPMGEVMDNLNKITKEKQVVVYCRSGKRSATIVRTLEQNGYNNVYNLTGGILAYSEEIDPTITKY
jgi:rhodanese-related sulfurtransferase